jgi:NDP-sugar pyrophosphorylase family protein
VNAMLLAAGLGTRLRAAGGDVPKALVDVGGEPLLARQLRYLREQGCTRVVVNVHHMADLIHSFLERTDAGVQVVVSDEPELLGTAGGVRHALEQLGPDPFFVLYGDVLVDEPLAPILETHVRLGAAATVTVYETVYIEGKGTVAMDDEGLVTAFTEKGAAVTPPALVNAGLYVVSPALLEPLTDSEFSDFGHDVFPAALERGERLAAHRLAEPVLDVGTPEALAEARRRAGR